MWFHNFITNKKMSSSNQIIQCYLIRNPKIDAIKTAKEIDDIN